MFAILLAPMSFTPPFWFLLLCVMAIGLVSDRLYDAVRTHPLVAVGVTSLSALLAYALLMYVCYCDYLFLGWFWY